MSVGGSKTSDGLIFFKTLRHESEIRNFYKNLLNQNPAEKMSKNQTFEPLNILEVAPDGTREMYGAVPWLQVVI